MTSSFLYHAWGLYTHECTREEYKGNTIILHIQTKEREKVCPRCGKRHLVKNGYRFRDFVGLPIGGKKVIKEERAHIEEYLQNAAEKKKELDKKISCSNILR